MAVHESTRPLTSLFTDTVAELTNLFQTEIRLVRAEINEKLSKVANSGVLIGAGAIVMVPAVFILLLAIVRWLAVAGLSEQWGLTLVGLVIAALGVVLLMKGINNLKGSALVPRRTIEQVRADMSVAKEQVR
ncbi:MAG: phage holin family protein [Xanthobacteraceae bacterium]